MKFHETSQNQNAVGNNSNDKSSSTANVGPEMLEKLQNLSNNNNNLYSSNQSYINKIANNIHSNALKQNSNNLGINTRMEIMKRLSELANENDEKNKYKEILGFSSPTSSQTTEQALSYINASYTKEENSLKQIKKVADDFKTLIGKAISEIGALNTNKDFGIEPQKRKLKELTKKTIDIKKIIFEVDKKIQNKIF